MPPDLIDKIMHDPAVVTEFLAVIAGILAVLGVLLRILTTKLKKVGQDASVAKEQLTNNHETNLRDDLTKVLNTIQDIVTQQTQIIKTQEEQREENIRGFKRMDHRFGEQHDMLIAETKERQMLDTRAQEEHKKIWTAIDNG